MVIKWTVFINPKVVHDIYRLTSKRTEALWALKAELEKDPHHPKATRREGYQNVYDIRFNGCLLVYAVYEDTRTIRFAEIVLLN